MRPLRDGELPGFVERGRAEYRRQLVEFAGLAPDEADEKAKRDFVIGEGHGNDVARSLYRSLGYAEQAVFMSKDFS